MISPSDTQDIPDAPTGASIGILEGLREVYAHMSARRRRQFLAVLVLMLVGGFAELATDLVRTQSRSQAGIAVRQQHALALPEARE